MLCFTFTSDDGPTIEYQEQRALLQQERSNTHGLESRVTRFESDLESQRQTIALLVSEKASLAASLERLEDAEASTLDIVFYFRTH
jgi:hypothetical protein